MEKIVVITGGTSGIGKACAELFENAGDKVLVLGRSAKVENEMHYICDVTNSDMVSRCFADIIKRFGRIDVLINSAGVGISGITELIPLEDAKNIFDINYFGTLLSIKNALPFMTKGSKIINIGSAMAFFPLPYRAHYAAVKSAVNALSFALRLELAPLQIDVSVVCPGDVKTNFTKNREKSFETNERYGKKMELMTKKMDAKQDKRMSVDIVAKEIYKIANRQKMKPMYIVGKKYKFLYNASRFASKNVLLKGIDKYVN